MNDEAPFQNVDVIDRDDYAPELMAVRRFIEVEPEREVDERLSEVFGGIVERVRRPISRSHTAGIQGGRLTVAAGQSFIWSLKAMWLGLKEPVHGVSGEHFQMLWGTYLDLLRRKITLDEETAIDLVRVEIANRGDSEFRHAAVKLLERNFTSPVPSALRSIIVRWADDLSVEPHANFRKLAKRLYTLAADF
jgi:hypothetical protein